MLLIILLDKLLTILLNSTCAVSVIFLTTGISLTFSAPFINAEKKLLQPIPKITRAITTIKMRVKIAPNFNINSTKTTNKFLILLFY